MDITRDQVLEVLKSVTHPSAGKNIVSLDLVQNLELSDGKVRFDLSFKAVNDPLKNSIKKACEKVLQAAFGKEIELEIAVKVEMKPKVKKERPILPGVKNIIAVSSGKGGVGKSTVSVNLAAAYANTGAKVGLIDADIFGPSVPKMLGIEDEKPFIEKINGQELLVPVEKYGMKVLSMGLFVDSSDATIWRGPMASNAFQQLIKDANWGDLDYLFIDLPPGTSDIHLTLVQTVPVTGAVIVSTPQDIALADVVKGINMFKNDNINVPLLGIIENMSWFTPEELPDNKYYIFGKGGCAKLADEMGVRLLGQIPIVQSVREGGDQGKPVVLQKELIAEAFKTVAENIRYALLDRNSTMQPTQKVEITKRR